MLSLISSGFALILAMSASSYAGGFQIAVDTPGKSSDAQVKDVVLIARTYGCLHPTDVKLAATAEGLVNGARQSIPLDLSSTGSGVYAIKQQWPSEGTWVIALNVVGANNSYVIGALVELGPNGQVLPGTKLEPGAIKGVHARVSQRQSARADIESALRNSAALKSQTSDDGDRIGPLTWMLTALGASVISIGVITRGRRRNRSDEITG
jgi:hypothetical protein